MKPPEPSPAGLNEELPGGTTPSAIRVLPAGARLDGFEVEALICEGSVCVVYWATDRALGVPVAIAEYMPAHLAQRNDDGQVTPRTSAQADVFAKGLKAFVSETRALARCNHPSLVRIVRLFEANATAYRVMPRYPAKRLLDARADMDEPPDEEALRALLDALLGALQAFHLAGGGHGKVSPHNILLLADGQPLLLGPGAAGRAIASDPIDEVKTSGEPCFAPIEQLVEADTPLQPSFDLYALAGVARYWMSGKLPAPAFGASTTARRETLADTVQRLRLTWPHLHYSESLLDALDNALSIYPAQRPQSVAQMRARLGNSPPAASRPVSPASTDAAVPDDVVPSSPVTAHKTEPAADAEEEELDAVMAFAPAPEPLAKSDLDHFDDDRSVRTTFARQLSAPRRIAAWSGVALVLLALLVVGVYEFRQEPQLAHVLDLLGISRGTGAGDSAAASSSAVSASAPETPSIAADSEAAKPMPTESTAAESPRAAAESASPTGAPIATDLGDANPMPTEPTAADPPTVVAQQPAPAPPPARVAQRPATRDPASPREACGGRTQFSLYRCMQTQCSQRQWASHAQCERFRATDSVD